MSLNLPNKDNIPSYFEEDVLNYLEQQQKTQCAGESDFKIPKILSGHDCVTSILQDIVSAIEKQKQAKVVYDKTLRDHNQYDLFDLSKTIPGFCIDEELYEKMTFRETLVIGVFENNSYGYGLHPDPAGGFSLNIEMARGSQPLDRKEFSLVEGVMSDMNLSNAEADEFIQGVFMHQLSLITLELTNQLASIFATASFKLMIPFPITCKNQITIIQYVIFDVLVNYTYFRKILLHGRQIN